MSERENLFGPIHKGIRAMIYDLGQRLGTTDFSDVPGSNALAEDLKRNLGASASNCVLCLLRTHSQHEERDLFAAVRPFDEEPVRLMVRDHRELRQRIFRLARTCDELLALTDPARRLEVGDRLHLEANDLFAAYLAHLNTEEAVIVPVMWERFTDAQLRGLRAQFYNSIPLPLFEQWMRWTLPALNRHELTVLLKGMRAEPAPSRYEHAVRLAEETVPAARWAAVRPGLDG